MTKIKQLLCRHWFTDTFRAEREYSAGAIICGEQRQFRAHEDVRQCRRCGMVDRIEVETEFLGWT